MIDAWTILLEFGLTVSQPSSKMVFGGVFIPLRLSYLIVDCAEARVAHPVD